MAPRHCSFTITPILLRVTAFVLLSVLLSANPAFSKLQAFVLPHSHDDVGWLLTPDEYFEYLVKDIYSSVVEALTSNSSRRFIVVEMAYFSRWWNLASTKQQQQFSTLVANGQIEFVIGGWTMEDEGCTTFSTNIDQMTLGHQLIYHLFGVRPRYGWQIDPFGASNVVHQQFALMGFDATVVDRIPEEEKQWRQQQRELEFVWLPSASDPSLQIFTHCLDQYFYWTAALPLASPIAPPIGSLDLKLLSDMVVDRIREKAGWLQTGNVLFPWGIDFAHFAADWDFAQMDRVMNYIQDRSDEYGVEVSYVTLSDYFDALYAANRTWTPYSGDFMTYDNGPHSYWAGYYSSRPALKYWVRSREALQRAAETMVALFAAASPSPIRSAACDNETVDASSAIEYMREAMGEATHHDAVTGTSELHVVHEDVHSWPTHSRYYAQHLANASVTVAPLIAALAPPATNGTSRPSYSLDQGLLLNLTQNSSVIVTVYNSLAWTTTQWLRLGVQSETIRVTDADGRPVPSQINPRRPSSPRPCQTGYGCGYDLSAPYDLFFIASLPPLGSASYRVSLADGGPRAAAEVFRPASSASTGATFTLANSMLSLTFSNDTGLLLSVRSLAAGLSSNLTSSFFSYVPATLDPFNISESAYIFHPAGPAAPVSSAPLSYSVIRGAYVAEVRQFFTSPCGSNTSTASPCGVAQTYRLYSSPSWSDFDNAIQVLTDLGPLATDTDVSLRFSSSLTNQGIFFADDNCWENHRRVFNGSLSDPISGNFYSVPCWLYLQDSVAGAQLTLLVDRAHAGSSLSSGQLELILHRRLNTSNINNAPFLTLNDVDRLENVGTLVLFDGIGNSVLARHRLTYLYQFPPTVLLAAAAPSVRPPTSYSAIPQQFPPALHLLTLAAYNCTTTLIRLAHVFEPGESANLSLPITIDLASYLNFTAIEERSLSTVWAATELVRRQWNVAGSERSVANRTTSGDNQPTLITLDPGQVRTFFLSGMQAPSTEEGSSFACQRPTSL